jgi:hypothetical protein
MIVSVCIVGHRSRLPKRWRSHGLRHLGANGLGRLMGPRSSSKTKLQRHQFRNLFKTEQSALTRHPLGVQETRLTSRTATALTDCEILRIKKKAMMLALHREQRFSDLFVAYLLARNIQYEEDLVDQLFNSSEKRLARILLLLAHFGKAGVPETVIPKISQETLAAMIGTTRSRVSFFMNRFRKLGFLNYGADGLQVHSSLLNIVLHD